MSVPFYPFLVLGNLPRWAWVVLAVAAALGVVAAMLGWHYLSDVCAAAAVLLGGLGGIALVRAGTERAHDRAALEASVAAVEGASERVEQAGREARERSAGMTRQESLDAMRTALRDVGIE